MTDNTKGLIGIFLISGIINNLVFDGQYLWELVIVILIFYLVGYRTGFTSRKQSELNRRDHVRD